MKATKTKFKAKPPILRSVEKNEPGGGLLVKLDLDTLDKLDRAVDAIHAFKNLLETYDGDHGANMWVLTQPHFDWLIEARDEIYAAWEVAREEKSGGAQ